ncbi:hypothetical protein GLOIN_2v1480835 [Rhizophagus irregularis DAOM 181602=DAOM 197198]|uniref:Uncharacterized protein n=1 Tax=Rhizophagus irregularis (strain DAOM 181602 / DAOM 197198 / MUCL 43194) TaxID=747089 RepID=A0A2P4PSQ6_RHIID|nr:hypothetical protein GLOIN_2v1480835 [Rhizophagus irregularis DAOM 181602=DAOM 197198]POG68421.1 hypothetical protein GLOIN_2v1480835 [Rhizophagus irregularis DAOM 181602=DAOM 197198]|eukprot:XP_025175287.1 hypothetical protein GLOIN_2v1480835 [Rhizophagus irregularis DAOM 181602=DAOM 197198]
MEPLIFLVMGPIKLASEGYNAERLASRIFINRSSSSKDHSGDSITLLVISWGAKQDVFQKSVAKRDVSQKSVNIRGCGSQCRGIWGTVVRDGSIALWDNFGNQIPSGFCAKKILNLYHEFVSTKAFGFLLTIKKHQNENKKFQTPCNKNLSTSEQKNKFKVLMFNMKPPS